MPIDDQARLYSVTELGSELGVSARTIRFYEDKALIAPQRAGGTRVYTARDRARMILILRGKRLGFSLREIKEYLDLYDRRRRRSGSRCSVLLRSVRARIGSLEQQGRRSSRRSPSCARSNSRPSMRCARMPGPHAAAAG